MKSTAPMEQSNEKNSNSHEYAVELILHLSCRLYVKASEILRFIASFCSVAGSFRRTDSILNIQIQLANYAGHAYPSQRAGMKYSYRHITVAVV
jgi:hypothetical protein